MIHSARCGSFFFFLDATLDNFEALTTNRANERITPGIALLGRHRHPFQGRELRIGGNGLCGSLPAHAAPDPAGARPGTGHRTRFESENRRRETPRCRSRRGSPTGSTAVSCKARGQFGTQVDLRPKQVQHWMGSTSPLDASPSYFRENAVGALIAPWLSIRGGTLDLGGSRLMRRPFERAGLGRMDEAQSAQTEWKRSSLCARGAMG